jgi:hypothetical protein
MRKLTILFLSAILSFTTITAKEGMWLPLLLKSLNERDMQAMGLRLSADDIYNVNKSSLKDAVISFGGFCTGEIISNRGLILTNHHCGYGRIQSHSSVENDYLTEGYWADSMGSELPNPGLTATFIVRMEDVTEAILGSYEVNDKETEKQKKIKDKMDELTAAATEGTHYEAYVRPFFYGNEYYLFVVETFKDVRLVGAPPSSIGKFGGDTDNWMWPRHTGDFSLFRIYANRENKPTEYDESNVPYRPKHHFPISLDGVDEGDFTMVFGFPGRTQEYLTASAIRQIKEVINPVRIAIRAEVLEAMDRQMRQSDKVRIQYASKYASTANYWKKWIGENMGLQRSNAIAKKEEEEAQFRKAIANKPQYQGLLEELDKRYQEIEPYALARTYFIEAIYRPIGIYSLARKYEEVVEKAENKEEISPEETDKLKEQLSAHFKDYDFETDMAIAAKMLAMYEKEVPAEFKPAFYNTTPKDDQAFYRANFGKSPFGSEETSQELLAKMNRGRAKKIMKDPAYQQVSEFFELYYDKIKPEYDRIEAEIDSLNHLYLKALQECVPGTYYPDANSTLRLAYGKVEDYQPRNAVDYDFFTTAEGILQKYDPGSTDFDLPERLIYLIENQKFGSYRDEDGSMHVCFIASNHTTGGNSGSPVLNGDGHLVGLNFDRNWEGTMSDINYDIDLCRNISVDIRYVLFIIDEFAGAYRLIDEMTLVSKK